MVRKDSHCCARKPGQVRLRQVVQSPSNSGRKRASPGLPSQGSARAAMNPIVQRAIITHDKRGNARPDDARPLTLVPKHVDVDTQFSEGKLPSSV